MQRLRDRVALITGGNTGIVKRLGTPDDLIGAFVLLASDEGRYFCGQTLHPNGGEIMP